MNKFLKLTEKTVHLEMINPLVRQGRNLKMSLKDERFGDQLSHLFYLDRTGKYMNRKFLEDIVKGIHKPTSSLKGENTIFKAPPSIRGLDSK